MRKSVIILLSQVSSKDRLALIALAARYFQSIIDANSIVSDKLTNEGSWSEARRATINKPSEATMRLRKDLQKEFNRVLGPVAPKDFDRVLMLFMLGCRIDA